MTSDLNRSSPTTYLSCLASACQSEFSLVLRQMISPNVELSIIGPQFFSHPPRYGKSATPTVSSSVRWSCLHFDYSSWHRLLHFHICWHDRNQHSVPNLHYVAQQEASTSEIASRKCPSRKTGDRFRKLDRQGESTLRVCLLNSCAQGKSLATKTLVQLYTMLCDPKLRGL